MDESRIGRIGELPRLRLVPLGEMPTPRACPRLVLTRVPETAEAPSGAAPRAVRPVDGDPGGAADAGRPSGGRVRPGRAVCGGRRTRASARSALFRVGRHSGGRGVMGLSLMAVMVVAGPRRVSAARRWTSRRTSRTGRGGRDAAR